MPPTPPPDIDLDAWRASADRILAWDPDTLFLTHFGPFQGARQQFQALFDHLAEWSRLVQRLLDDASIGDDERQQRFVDAALLELRRRVGRRRGRRLRAGRRAYIFVAGIGSLLAQASEPLVVGTRVELAPDWRTTCYEHTSWF